MENFEVPVRHTPAIFAVVLLVAIALSYAIAVIRGQVYPFLPSISRTAAFEPGGSLFSLLLSFVILAALILISMRYLQVFADASKQENRGQAGTDFNATSFLFGVLMVFGIAVVASFRCPLTKEEDGTLGTIHYVGSAILYLSGAFYCWLQTIMTFYMSTRRTFVTRLAVTLVYCVTGATFPFIKAVAYLLFDGSGDPANIATWHPGQGGHTVHVIACAGEWISVISLAMFALTFRQELRDFRLELRCLCVDTQKYSRVNQHDTSTHK